jgi:hypothetical protein
MPRENGEGKYVFSIIKIKVNHVDFTTRKMLLHLRSFVRPKIKVDYYINNKNSSEFSCVGQLGETQFKFLSC